MKLSEIEYIASDEQFVKIEYENIKPYYWISNYGRIYSETRGGKILSPFIDDHGYHRIELATTPSAKKYFVHRLVAYMFIDGYFEGALVNHIDSDRLNNHVSNLEWCTHQENTDHGCEYGHILENNTSEFRNLNTAHSIDDARLCCILISYGMSNSQILSHFEFNSKRERKNMNTFLNDLRGKRTFVWLSDRYF